MIDNLVNRIFCGDCIEVLQTFPSGFVDLVLTDPPYGISKEVKITRSRNSKYKGKDINLVFGNWDNFDNLKEFFEFTFSWLDECVRVLRDGGMFISYFDRDKINFVSYYLQSKYNFKHKGYYADCKSNPVPQARKVKWMTGWEMVGMWQKPGGELTYNYQLGQQKDYGIRPIVMGRERTKHPTQKPLSVISLFISYWTSEGNIVLDPFAGSGTTLVACKRLNRRYIGIELNEEFIKLIEERLNILL